MTVSPDAVDDTLISEAESPPSQLWSGLLLLGCAVVALLWANSPWASSYDALRHAPLGRTTVEHAVNDGLMALFFLLVGLEIKHEMLDGALASWRQSALPLVGALGGMVVPALLFTWLARGSGATAGWGVPMATDIAFALGILALLGNRVPAGLRVFLAALAIADDLGAVLVIALFYTPEIDPKGLVVSSALLFALFRLNLRGVSAVWPYLALGVLLWLAVLRSGIHASIAGVLLALVIPARGMSNVQDRLEAALHHPVTYGVVPLFAFINAGVALPANLGSFTGEPAVMATLVGLLLGKPLGIFGAAWVAVRLGWAQLPMHSSWPQLVGVAVLGGIGFTMSLFIATLAFGATSQLDAAKVGVLAGSTLAAIAGTLVLRLSTCPPTVSPAEDSA